MKQILTLLIALTAFSPAALACRCLPVTFEEELQRSEQVFTGTVIKRTEKDYVAYFLFKVTSAYKGEIKDTITIQSRVGGPACGVNFEVGKDYVVYASESHTNSCRRNERVEKSKDVLKLKFLLDKDFNSGLGQTASPDLNDKESDYFNQKLQSRRGDFSFDKKKVAFVISGSFITKQDYFTKWGDKDAVTDLIILNESEKQKTNGYDAIIVLWRKQGIGKSFRKKTIRKLGKV